ncbi:MAG: DUF308 domain-containing protein [Bacteroides sp.]|nr:DUF308 domain-containing protein [Bacteroides sp.]
MWPGQAIIYLVLTIGVLFLLPGLFGLVSYVLTARKRKEAGYSVPFPIIALGSTLFGIWLIVMPDFFVTSLMYVLGVLLVLAGVSQLANLAAARSSVHVPWGIYVIPLLVLVAGLVVLFDPFAAAEVPFMILGCSFIVYALMDLFRMFKYRRLMKNKIQDITPIEEIKN